MKIKGYAALYVKSVFITARGFRRDRLDIVLEVLQVYRTNNWFLKNKVKTE
jgi:hypothetical protein